MSTKFPDPRACAETAPVSSGPPPEDPDLAKVDNWFSYHPPTPAQQRAYEELRAQARQLAQTICLECPPSADRTAALRKLRECVMTANASIACQGR